MPQVEFNNDQFHRILSNNPACTDVTSEPGSQISWSLKHSHGNLLGHEIRAGWEFLRRNHDGRYTDRSLMAILAEADTLDNESYGGPSAVTTAGNGLVMLSAAEAISFDEDTEVKRGGLLGVMFLVPGEEGEARGIIAVREEARRHRLGTSLCVMAAQHTRKLNLWMGAEAIAPQRFALAAGFMPHSFNRQNAISYRNEGRLNVPESQFEALAPLDARIAAEESITYSDTAEVPVSYDVDGDDWEPGDREDPQGVRDHIESGRACAERNCCGNPNSSAWDAIPRSTRRRINAYRELGLPMPLNLSITAEQATSRTWS